MSSAPALTTKARARVSIATMLGTAALLAACTAPDPGSDGTGDDGAPAGAGGTAGAELSVGDDVRTFVADEPDAGGQGEAIVGRVVVGSGGCLALEDIGDDEAEEDDAAEDDDAPPLVVWPPETPATPGDQPGVVVDDSEVMVGDAIEATGARAPAGDLASALPPGCDLGGDVVWVHGDVEVVRP